MPRWLSWDERRREIQQELTFAAAGIGGLVNIDSEEDDVPYCVECGEPMPCRFEQNAE
jgi:hypothetical protein